MSVTLSVRPTGPIKQFAWALLAASATLTCGKFGHAAVNFGTPATATGGPAPIGRLPESPVAGDSVLIGTDMAAENATVILNVNGAASGMLTIVDGMTLRTSTSSLNISGTTQISGQNIVGPSTFASCLRIENGVLGTDFTTENLSVSNFGRVTLENGSSMVVDGVATIGENCCAQRQRLCLFDEEQRTALDNDGRLEATVGGLTIFQTADGRIDLDGTSGNGLVVVNSGGGNGLEINGDQLTDPFSSDIEMTSAPAWKSISRTAGAPVRQVRSPSPAAAICRLRSSTATRSTGPAS